MPDRQHDVGDLITANLRIARSAATWAARRYKVRWDECYADALVGLWEAAKRYRDDRDCSFATWARHICCQRAIDGVRERQGWRRRHRKAYLTLPLLEGLPCSGPEPSASVESEDEVRWLTRRLPEREQRTVIACWAHGQKQKDYADEEGVVFSAISFRLARARAQMQTYCQEGENG